MDRIGLIGPALRGFYCDTLWLYTNPGIRECGKAVFICLRPLAFLYTYRVSHTCNLDFSRGSAVSRRKCSSDAVFNEIHFLKNRGELHVIFSDHWCVHTFWVRPISREKHRYSSYENQRFSPNIFLLRLVRRTLSSHHHNLLVYSSH